MQHYRNSLTPQEGHTASSEIPQFEDFLTPEQRLDAIADILNTIAVRVIRKQNEDTQKDNF